MGERRVAKQVLSIGRGGMSDLTVGRAWWGIGERLMGSASRGTSVFGGRIL